MWNSGPPPNTVILSPHFGQRSVEIQGLPPNHANAGSSPKVQAQNDNASMRDLNGATLPGMKDCYVYIMASRSRTLYTGVTNSLDRRVAEHKLKLIPGFTSLYNIDRLVYFEHHGDIRVAIRREKQIKGWTRAKKARTHRVHQSRMVRFERGLVWKGTTGPSSR